MGQDIIARNEVKLHSGCVVLEGQQALPHDGVLLLTGDKAEMGSRPWPAGPWRQLSSLLTETLGHI